MDFFMISQLVGTSKTFPTFIAHVAFAAFMDFGDMSSKLVIVEKSLAAKLAIWLFIQVILSEMRQQSWFVVSVQVTAWTRKQRQIFMDSFAMG